MMIAIWIAALLGLALWSLAAWGLHAVLTIDAKQLQDLKPLIERIPYGEQIDQWVPGWQAMLAAAVDLSQAMLGWLGSAAPWLVWAVWAVGAVVLLGVAGLTSLAVMLIRKGMAPSKPAAPLGPASR